MPISANAAATATVQAPAMCHHAIATVQAPAMYHRAIATVQAPVMSHQIYEATQAASQRFRGDNPRQRLNLK